MGVTDDVLWKGWPKRAGPDDWTQWLADGGNGNGTGVRSRLAEYLQDKVEDVEENRIPTWLRTARYDYTALAPAKCRAVNVYLRTTKADFLTAISEQGSFVMSQGHTWASATGNLVSFSDGTVSEQELTNIDIRCSMYLLVGCVGLTVSSPLLDRTFVHSGACAIAPSGVCLEGTSAKNGSYTGVLLDYLITSDNPMNTKSIEVFIGALNRLNRVSRFEAIQ